jgi:long-subunit acyl-CoA synthetase (AMP-forming)
MHKLVRQISFFFIKNLLFPFCLDDDILNLRPTQKDIAVIMYTSGSTGTPKGN